MSNFNQLKQEIIRLKAQELAPQVRNESTKLDQLIMEAKNILLEVQKHNDQLTQIHLEGQLTAYQNILESNLTKEELQIESHQLEKYLTSLQQIQEQVAQIIQTNLPSSSQGGNY